MLVFLIKGELIMLGRKNFTQEEIDNGKATVNEMLERYKNFRRLLTAPQAIKNSKLHNLTLRDNSLTT